MLKKLFLLSTVASLAAFPALAQEATEPTTPPPPAEQAAPAQPSDQVPAGDMTQQPTTDPAAPATAESEPATPPPAEAVIPAQAADQVRAEKLIGMDVYDTDGEKVGTVKDILFGPDGKATGMVLSVGGVLGVGAKQVGLQWSEIDIQPDAEVAKVQYKRNQLEAAPDFKSQEAQKAESDAAQMQTEQEGAPAAPPAPTGTQ